MADRWIFAPDLRTASIDLLSPVGDPQGDCLEWDGRFIFFRQALQVTLPGSWDPSCSPLFLLRQSLYRLGVYRCTGPPSPDIRGCSIGVSG